MIGAAAEGARVKEGGKGSVAAGKRAASGGEESVTREARSARQIRCDNWRDDDWRSGRSIKMNNCNVNNEMKCKR